MKKSLFLSALLAIATSGGANAAIVNLSIDSTSLATSAATPLTAGVARFGYFQAAPAGTETIAQLEDAFIQVASYTITGDIAFTNLTYDNALSYSSGDNLTTLPYDLSANNANVGGDIAGGSIYVWVLDNANSSLATEHGLFEASAFGYVWGDNQNVPNGDSQFSFDINSGDGMNAIIGTASADIGTTRHQLASITVIPEPSRALLGLIGLGAVVLRRRRA